MEYPVTPKGLRVPEHWFTGAWASKPLVSEVISGASSLTRGPPAALQLPIPRCWELPTTFMLGEVGARGHSGAEMKN